MDELRRETALMSSTPFTIFTFESFEHTYHNKMKVQSLREVCRILFLYCIVAGFAPMLALSITRINHLGHVYSPKANFDAFKKTFHFLQKTMLRNSHESGIDNTAVQDTHVLNDKEIAVTSSIELPFSVHTAFDAFSDLSRQPTWSHWLKSVQYIHGDGDPSNPTTKWTLGWRGFTFSWIAKSTKLIRPHVIEWESVSGLKNRGTVKFLELSGNDDTKENKTEMKLTLIFITPRIVSAMFNNSGRIKSVIETAVIQKTLVNFRDVVLRHDLKDTIC